MIVASTEDIRKHVAVAKSFQFESFAPYIPRAVNKFTNRYVGKLHETLADEPLADEILSEARGLLRAALVNFGMYLYVPVGSVMIDSAGVSTIQQTDRAQPEWQRIKDLQRDFLSAAHEAMDQLLALMETNKSSFSEWAGSSAYTQSKSVLVNNTDTFNRYYHIFESRQTYLALIPSMIQVEDQYISTFLCEDLITELKETEPAGIKKKVKEALQKAVVAFTVAKICEEGLFHIDASGVKLKFDALPNDKIQTPDYGKPAQWVSNTVNKLTANGNNYLDMAAKLINANLAEFNHCGGSPIITGDSNGGGFEPYNTKSVLGL